ncbi:hypothetical protein [Gallibacterium anatis]|uniref:Uncharacterized protein n=1 Tax=Gallibacterium anatis 4895 TaxID=1396510 RepID=A0A0A3ADU1_9PAST|nr:hypothetical protein [Gallibacterium anatis]KGQ59739.1 hypothetical protein IO48_11000 [Gallibacterium anatis 4895]
MIIYVLKNSIGSYKPLVYVSERPIDDEFGDYIEFEVSDISDLDGHTLIEHPQGIFNIVPHPPKNYVWNGSEFIKDEEAVAFNLEQTKKAAIKLINDEAAKAYNSKDRFAQEYIVREAEALAFKAANYEGEVPRQVAAFATPAGLEPKAAADLTIAQAAKLREAFNQIGELRMSAYELQPLETEFDVNERAAQIVLAIRKIAEEM